jgi:hypothetical protein
MGNTNNDSGCWVGCLTIIGVLVVLHFVGFAIKQCQCSFIKLCPEEPPYYTTDDNRYHRDNCPYMTKDNYVGDEYESREAAETDGYEACSYCLE